MIKNNFRLLPLSTFFLSFQAWLDLESATSDSPIFESGVYPATNSGLTKAVQRAETFLALVKSRRKQLDSLSAEAEDMMNPDVAHELNKFQTQLGDIERRHADKLVNIIFIISLI